MGIFGKLFHKKDNFDFDPGSDSLGGEGLGGDGLGLDMSDSSKGPSLGLDSASDDSLGLNQGANDPALGGTDPNSPSDGFDPKLQDPFAKQNPQPHNGADSYDSQNSDSSSQGPNNSISGHEFELLSSKLDTIKAELDAMSQRMKKMEMYIDHQDNDKKRPMW